MANTVLYVVIITDRANEDISDVRIFDTDVKVVDYVRKKMNYKVRDIRKCVDNVIENGWYSSDDDRYEVYYYKRELE